MNSSAGTLSLREVASGGKAALARALSQLERRPDAPETLALLSDAYRAPRAHVIGLTGPPGVGKSTLMGALIDALRAEGRTLGVIAVDPSSARSGGALLGDRVRLSRETVDDGVFVRSMAARDRLGGLADLTIAAMVLMRAVFDVVLIETVGVGQSETDVASVADTVVFCVQPGSGDSLQFMKAGIVEIPHIALVTKADMGKAAQRALADLKGALSLTEQAKEHWPVAVMSVAATEREGITSFIETLDRHMAWLEETGRLKAARHAQAELWLRAAVRERFGRDGLRRAGDLKLAGDTSPFARMGQVMPDLAQR
ncbi:methylmalonyl Co-A mutase-associated GTPase MeaB [Denitrobaculum tricleocarpae]|uniref:methylmalonyl Co-A mutase-associated GTPase MeaB n=1 Tax=Denitrobaculum tricleocarpae TaxID=2591009 RepID=UPI001FE78FFF|nr:methylmalonyl Co-A mutase-associated GTPase MeaB [Denitrobaculum tricleocarpae]